MYLKINNKVLFRNYDSFGYLTDNRNFGYEQINTKGKKHIGDKILSESGAVFLSALNKKPQSINDLVEKISTQFNDVDISTIKNDAIDFYLKLEQDGFISSGITRQECAAKDKKFSYKTLEPEIIENNSSSTFFHLEKTTQEFFEEHFNGKPQLTNLHLEIISKCNERCIHCYIPHESKINQMESDLFNNILLQCKKMNLLHLTLSGGEPMLHKDFCNFLRMCREYDFSVNVLTNLTLLNDDILQEMKLNSLLNVQVSLYSMNSDIHDEITQVKGSFNKTQNAILKLIDNDIPLQISCPIMKQNKNCIHEVIEWAKQKKIQVGDDYGILASYNHLSSNLSCRLSIDEISELITNRITNDVKYLHQVEMVAEKKRNKTSDDFVCSICYSSICISDNGNFYPCAGWQDYILGNIKETTLNEIWNYSPKVQFLRNLRNKDFPQCLECIDKEYCTMCLVRNANENDKGDPFVVNKYFCNIAKIHKDLIINGKNENNSERL